MCWYRSYLIIKFICWKKKGSNSYKKRKQLLKKGETTRIIRGNNSNKKGKQHAYKRETTRIKS